MALKKEKERKTSEKEEKNKINKHQKSGVMTSQ